MAREIASFCQVRIHLMYVTAKRYVPHLKFGRDWLISGHVLMYVRVSKCRLY